MKAIKPSAVYTTKTAGDQFSELHYLVSWKDYSEDKSTWEPALVVNYFLRMISTFYKQHPKKPTATSLLINSAPLMAKSLAKPFAKTLK